MSTSVTSVVSHFPSPQNGFTTTLSSTISSGAATVGLASVAGYSNGQIFVGVVDPSDVTKKQTFTGVVDTAGVQITSVVWTAGTNQSHNSGATVVDYATATHIAMMTKGLLVSHNQAGTMITSLPLTTPKITTSINDSSGNEVIKTPATASAVNEVTITNAATTATPSISATGDDTAINLNLRGKGLAKTVTIGAGATTIFPYDYVVSGCVWTADNVGVNLNASMTAGVVVINGNPITVAAVTARAFTTNVDTYIDVLDNGDGTGLLVYTTAATNAASAALASNSIRIGIIQAAATITATTKVNQGQEDKVFPIASSIAYTVTDSLGNLICPRDPSRRTLGFRQIISNFTLSAAQTTPTQITGLTCPVIVPTGRKVSVTTYTGALQPAAGVAVLSVWDGVVNSGTQVTSANGAATNQGTIANTTVTPAATSKTYNAGTSNSGANNVTIGASSTQPAYIRVDLA